MRHRCGTHDLGGEYRLTGGTLLSVNPLGQTIRETTQTNAPSFVNVQVKLEIKL